jgi:hypothetical protein
MDAHYFKITSIRLDSNLTHSNQTTRQSKKIKFIKRSLFHKLENLEPYASMVPIRLCFVRK